MVFDLHTTKNKEIQKLAQEIMQELNDWYEFTWNQNTPNLFLISDKKTFQSLAGGKSEPWLRGFSDYSNNIYVYTPEAQGKYTSHKYDKDDYRRFIKHELDHKYFGVFTKGLREPKWLIEGNAGYVSEQYEFFPKISRFSKFLELDKSMSAEGYGESAFAVYLLVENFGKKKYLKFIKDLATKKLKADFKNTFGISLSYKSLNETLNQLIPPK